MVRLTIPAQHPYRDLMVSAVFTAIEAERGSLDANARDELASALVEAFNNLVLHAYRDLRGGTIDLRTRATATSVEVVLSDRGRSFDPSQIPSYMAPQTEDVGDLDLDRLPECGMGLFIIRSFMDEVTYVAGGGGEPNVLVLRKSWPAPQSAAERPAAGAAERVCLSPGGDCSVVPSSDQSRNAPGNQARSASKTEPGQALFGIVREAPRRPIASKKESSRSGWRMRSVAVPSDEPSTAGSLKRK